MKKKIVSGVVIGALMVFSAWAAQAVKPTVRIADQHKQIVLAKEIPTAFGDWREDVNQVSEVVNPTLDAEIKKIYAQTLSRTYLNRDGERIMLSIAYGRDQSEDLSVHYPEGCYGAQGFQVTPVTYDVMHSVVGDIPASRLVATLNNRIEPITYWIVVGDKAVRNSWELKTVKLSYALAREIPDATLIRVSTINPDTAASYRLQQDFVNQMMTSITPSLRAHFSGHLQ